MAMGFGRFSLGMAALVALGSGALPAKAEVAPISCMLMPLRESRIGADQPGIVLAREVDRNQRVTKGAVLVRLDRSLLEADVTRAELTRDALKTRLERSEALTQNNVIAKDEIERLRTEYGVAEADLLSARERLRRSEIVAPFDGVVTATAIEPGEMTTSDPLLTLADVAQLRAMVIYPVEAWGQIAPGAELSVTALVGGVTRVGRVRAVDSFIDAAANSFTLEVSLDNRALDMPAGSACQVAQVAG